MFRWVEPMTGEPCLLVAVESQTYMYPHSSHPVCSLQVEMLMLQIQDELVFLKNWHLWYNYYIPRLANCRGRQLLIGKYSYSPDTASMFATSTFQLVAESVCGSSANTCIAVLIGVYMHGMLKQHPCMLSYSALYAWCIENVYACCVNMCACILC